MDRFFILSDPVITIRSKYYVSVLLQRLGVGRISKITPALINMAGSESTTVYSKFRSDFYRYMAGGNIKNEHLVATIDKLLPGTARVIRHPLWPLLSMRRSEEVVLVELAQMLEPSLHQYLHKYDEGSHAIGFISLSKRRNWFRQGSKFLHAIDRRSLDELAALVIAIEAHEMRGEYGVSRLLRELMRSFFVELSLVAEFDEVVGSLYEEVHRRISKVPRGEGVFYMFAQMLAEEGPEEMLKIIKNVSAGRASHSGTYSEILRCSRII